MAIAVEGQRWVSDREPELGLGVIVAVDDARVTVAFPASGEQRIYARGTSVLSRVRFRPGETVRDRAGHGLRVEGVHEEGGLLTYVGEGRRLREDAISDATSLSRPPERLLAGQVEPGAVFDLRLRTLRAQARLRRSELRGCLGARVDLIPHQFYLLREVTARPLPRVLLADEVGLGKTIEAGLIVHRLLTIGRLQRVLILVPEPLIHQWFVELLRRFNLWFSLYDERRCQELEETEPQVNPFHAAQLVLAPIDLTTSEHRVRQASEAGWDLVVVDEAHHLKWSPEEVSPQYRAIEELASRTPGLLLLTATPTQLGAEGHFARLRLLDPHRYGTLEAFLAERARYGEVAQVVDRVLRRLPLRPDDRERLERWFDRDPERLREHLDALAGGAVEAGEGLIRVLLDQYGPGRVIFRNTRAAMTGFPPRLFQPAVLPDPGPTLRARLARELEAEETGASSGLRYSFKDDPRIEWLVDLLRSVRPAKVVLICRTQRKALAVAAALDQHMHGRVALFHEGLPLIQRDRQAAWFAEPEGAQLLLCSEIGSEGRNFQFAHHLVLWDLPLSPGLVEQRIGRLDRIGQTEAIKLHVPFFQGGPDQVVTDWYHRGLGALGAPLQAGDDYETAFRRRLLEAALKAGRPAGLEPAEVEALVAETAQFRAELVEKLRQGRDRLLELHSLDRAQAERWVAQVRDADGDPSWRRFLLDLLDHFGVGVQEHEEGDIFLDPRRAFIEAFPSLPPEGMLATFDRRRALAREDVVFLSADHPLLRDAIDLLLSGPAGTTAFVRQWGPNPDLLLEAVYVVEAVSDLRWQVDRFLAPDPLRVVASLRGPSPAGEEHGSLEGMADADVHRFLEGPGFRADVLGELVEAAGAEAAEKLRTLVAQATAECRRALGAELQRLVDLQRLNDHVRPEEIARQGEELERTVAAIAQARLRLDAVRLVLVAPDAGR